MLNQVHISKRMGKGFISDFGITFFHTLYRLSHWQLSWRSNFQSVVIYRNLYRTMIQITTMYHGIDNQLTNGIRWNLINILPINSNNGSTQMNISQNKLKCFLYLSPKRTGIFSTVNKYRFRCTLEHATLRCNMKSTVACQNSKGIRWIIFSLTLNQNPPGTQLLSANIFDGCFLLLIMGIPDCLLLHRFAKSINIFIRDIQSRTQSLIVVTVTALKQQLFYHILVGKAGSSCNTDIYTAISAKGFDIIWALSALRNLYHNDSFSFNRL